MNTPREDGRCPNEELAVGWALRALEPDDEQALRAHLPGCPVCQEIVRSTEQVTALLGGSLPQEDPPTRLRQKVLGSVAHTPQEAYEPLPFRIGSSLSTPSDGRPAEIVALPRPRSRVPRLAAAAVVLVLAVAVGALGWQVSNLTGQQQTQSQLLAVLGDPAMHRTVLRAGDGQEAAVLLSSPTSAAVLPTGLRPNNAADQTYVVWGLSTGTPIALSSFDVASSAAELIKWDNAAAQHQKFAISLEPGRGLPAKPTDVIANGEVTN
ncbi:anti-sigma factor [Kutzneria sp. CA-103260]|uniref:anti-sigma factor n=1 Tax=Kutzneria sp. CA-103260 TaxID=2802641 RepID=UPI001BA454EB|nr:anti-sigma factor [Kutzneria sp. CA-103260]QUQ67064.1 Anti-sigma-K factor rskA [Kutzneria sp. CA-103260]